MNLDVEHVAARLAELRATYTLERKVQRRLDELRNLLELTRYLQHRGRADEGDS